MANTLKSAFPSKQIKKNGETLVLGTGTLTHTPIDIIEKNDINTQYRKLIYINYQGWWYRTPFKTIEECEEYLTHNKTYSKEQLFDLIYKIVEG